MSRYFLLIFTFISFTYGQSTEHFRLVTEKDEAFEGGTEADIPATSLFQCCLACLSNAKCVAVNFEYFLTDVKERKCVLLRYLNAVVGKKQKLGFGTFVAVSRLNQDSFSYCASLDKGSGYYGVRLSGKTVHISCEAYWLVIQRREDGSVNFDRNWTDYKEGFGDISMRDLWLGNEYIHSLTTMLPCTLKVVVTLDNGTEYWAQYSRFSIASEAQSYKMAGAVYDGGTTGDFFTDKSSDFGHALGKDFSTKDRDSTGSLKCAETYRGGWWYANCYQASLNGVYGVGCTRNQNYCIKIVPLQRYGLNIVKVVMKILPVLPL